MRYTFTDTTGTGTLSLPAEAMSINGTYIENVIEGYSTLYATGRDMLEPEVESDEVGKHDGEVYLYKRYPARTIVVGFQLIADTPAHFRSRFNQLNDILNVENATIIFNDEDDKYFIGTPSGADQPDEGLLSVTAEFEILCVDPFKYSTEETEVSAVNGVFTVTYDGTYPAYPRLEATFSEDCGFVAWANDAEKVIQIGDVNELDTTSADASQTLFNQKMTSISSVWTQNAGVAVSNTTLAGTMSVLTDPKGTKIAGASAVGSASGYHGASILRSVPADSGGVVGATDFRYSWNQRYAMTNNATAQYGFSQVFLINNTNGTRTIVAGVGFYKSNAGNTHWRYFYINGSIAKKVDGYKATYDNKPYGFNSASPMTSSIQKVGSKVTFSIGTSKYSFTNDDIEDMAVNEIQWTCGALGSVTRFPANQIGLISHKFIKDKCDTFVDIPNKFSEDDVVTVDCSNGEILLNNTPMPEYGAIGNEFEGFTLSKGTNYITTSYSDWVTNAPTLKLKYRERYI